MPNNKWVSLDFVSLHTMPENLINNIKMVVTAYLQPLGDFQIAWNDGHLREAVDRCNQECIFFYSNLGINPPSHLKYLGYLLYTTTQLDFVCIEGIDGKEKTKLTEANPQAAALLKLFTNEFLMFIAIFYILNKMQEDRTHDKRYDTKLPPLHYRFIRSMVDYLRHDDDAPLDYTKEPFDLYMVLKSMDLFGVICDYK